MGAFDHLIPPPESAAGAFDHLIPKPEEARGAFNHLVPDEPPATEDFASHVAWTQAKFRGISKPDAIRMVASKFTRALPDNPTAFDAFKDTLSELPGEAAKSVVRTGLTAPLRLVSRVGDQFTQDNSQPVNPHTPGPLERFANVVDSSAEVAFPSPEQPGLEHAVAQGGGQVATMLAGGVALKALGAGAGLTTAGITASAGVSEFDDAFGRAVERGDDADTAFAKSLGYGTVASLIENRLGAGRLWRQMFPSAELAAQKLTALGVSRAVGGNILAGGVEEGSQRFAQNLIVDEKPSLEGVMQEAIPGAIIEGAMGLPASVGNRIQQGQQFNAEKQLLEDSANRIALEATIPQGAGVVQPSVRGAFDHLIPKSPQSQAPESSQNSDSDAGLGNGKQNPPGAVTATSPAPAASPEQQAQVRAELQALPGAAQDLIEDGGSRMENGRKVPALTSEQTDAGLRESPAEDNTPATKADLAALASFIQNGGPNPFAAKPEPKTGLTGVTGLGTQAQKNTTPTTGQSGVNGATGAQSATTSPRATTEPQPQNPVNLVNPVSAKPTLPPATSSQVDITEAEKTELEALRKKDKSELLEGLEEQRMYELNRKESATKRRSKTASESAALKEAGITVPDSFLNPEPGTENHITGWTKDKNGFIQIRTETHKGGTVSTRLTTLKSGDTLRAGMDDSIKGTTRYDESTSNEPNIQTNPANAAAGNGQEVAQTQVLPQTPQGNAPSGKPVGTIVEPSPGMRYQKQADGVWARLGFDGKPSGRVTAQQAAQFEALPVGQTTSSQNPSSQTTSKPTKWTPTAGKLAVVNLTGRGKGRLARVLQVQPDGDATVQIKGEDGTRYVKLSQMRATGAEQSRLNRADELAELDPADVESVKQDAAEFDRLVEDYAPQLDWAPGEAYSEAAEGTELRADAVARGELRKAARRNAARAAGIASFQESSLVERAEALPKLEAYLKQQFPGDNSIAKRRVLEQFSRSEADPEQTATVKRDQATLDQLAAANPRKSYLQGLRSVGRTGRTGRGQGGLRQRGSGAGVLPVAGASTVTELERIFGVRIIFVDGAEFNGLKVSGSKIILINTKSPRATMAIAGHELLHHIKATHPGLYADFVAQARALLRNSEQFRAELARKGYSNLTEAIVAEEMFADVLGDAVLDPVFLQKLAKSEPNLFKRFARTAVKWLEKLIAKAKALTGFDSAQYVTDLEAMRHELLNLLRDAGRETQYQKAGIEQETSNIQHPTSNAEGEGQFSQQRMQFSNATITAPGVVDLGDRFSLTAHHGTPHKVDKFTTAKIGTGEGAQVYGWGLYFAENEKVAEDYATTLAKRAGKGDKPQRMTLDGVDYGEMSGSLSSEEEAAWFEIDQRQRWWNPDKVDPLARVEQELTKTVENYQKVRAKMKAGRGIAEQGLTEQDMQAFLTAEHTLKWLKKNRRRIAVKKAEAGGGNKYTVELNVEDEDLLDWDKPAEQQSEKVRNAIFVITGTRASSMTDGRDAYRAMMRGMQGPDFDYLKGRARELTQAMYDAGIKGIRYLDHGSRGTPMWFVNLDDGSSQHYDSEETANKAAVRARENGYTATVQKSQTYNYVIFSDDDITITHENGQEVGARDMFSMEGGDLFGAPESVEEQRERIKNEKLKIQNAKAKEAMQERAGARLIGKDLDTTQEMFGAEVKRDKAGQGDMFSLENKQFPERFALAKPIKGPTGASIVGYEWRSTMGEKYSAREGGMVEARVSDWDNADESTGTGRSIVHVFYVEHPNGKVHPEGIRSAQTVLGINESRLMTIAKKERAAQQYRQDQERAEMASYDKSAVATAQEAARDYRKWNYSPMRTFEENNDGFNESALFEKNGKFIRRNWKAAERMQRNGWTLVKDDPARTGGTAKAIDSVRETEPESQASGGVQQDMFSLEAGPRWRSNIQSALASWQNKGTPEQLRAHLAKTRGAMDEAEWIGLDEFLKDKPSVTKQQVAEFVQTNTVDVQEVTKGGRRIDDSNMAGEMKDLIADYNRGEIHEGDLKEGGRRLGYTVEMDGQDISSIYENTAGETKFANYQLPGGENYRELLLTLPETGDMAKLPEGYRIEDGHLNGRTRYSVHGPGQGRYASGDTREQAIASFYRQHPSKQTFKSSHFDEANILAHVRFNERTDADGKRVLFIEEVQSDWHQKGRKEGYADKNRKGNFAVVSKETGEIMLEGVGILDAEAYSARNGGKIYDMGSPKIPNAPFKQTWPMLAMKRMIRYASENGFDRIAWTTGEQQAERYDLSKQLSEVVAAVHHKEPDTALVSAYDKNGRPVLTRRVPMKDLPDVVGKDLADKIAAQPKDNEDHAYRGLDLKVGGEGMKGFYDKILPGEVNKFVKKWGGRVGRTDLSQNPRVLNYPGGVFQIQGSQTEYRIREYGDEWRIQWRPTPQDTWIQNTTSFKTQGDAANSVIKGIGVPVHSLDITPAMKGAALEGFDMFSLPKPEDQSEFAKVQADISAAEAELMAAIRQTVLPGDQRQGTRAEVFAAKNDAHRKLRALLAKQLKMMTDIRNLDAARSPEETANLISQTVDLLNSIQDDISERTAKSETVPADLTKLRTDLQERLAMLKGWTDAQQDEDRGLRMANGGKQTEAGRARLLALESATDPQHKTFGEWWQTVKNGLRYLTSPIPELPLTGERAEKSALFRRGYRLFAVENNRVRKEAAERVNQVLEPLTKLGRTPASNEALRQYYKLGEERERAAMDETKRKAIAERMLKLEETTLNKDPFNLFRRLVLYKDLRWRGTYLKNDAGKPITLPMGLTVDEVASELRRTYKLIENHPDGLAITEALRRHYKLTDDLQKSILEHGEIIPESLRNPLYFPHHVIDSWSGNIARVRPSTEEDFRKYLIAPTGSAKLIQTDYLKAMYLHTADVLAHNARVDLVDKYWKPYDISEQLKAQHGDKWNLPWNIPPGYKIFTPFNKLPLRMDYVLSREVLADKLGVLFNDGDLRERMGDTGRVLKVKPEDLHAAMVAGEKIQWVLPAEIADALNGIAKREAAAANPGLGHAIGLPFRAVNNFWKKTKLFAPWNWIRYEYGNLSTDAIDKVLAADPGAAKYLGRAAREVWQSGNEDFEATPEFQAAAREGVFDTITAGEAGELTKLPEFKAFLTGNEARWDKVRSFLERPMRGSKFREATFRYAKFLADVERLRAGKEPTYAGAFHGDIEALGEDVDGQRRMLEGDELIYAKAAEISLKTYGDYNSLGVAGQWLRQYAVPFWSWQDVNFRYHANQLRNIADGLLAGDRQHINTARKAALRYAGVRVVSTLVAIGIAKELWNQFGGPLLGLWDDDDDLESKLSEQDRRRGHLLLGKDKDGKVKVVYTPSAWSDVAEWMGGQNMKRLFMEYARGQITLDQFVTDYAKQLPGDVLNKLAQSVGPLGKAPYETISGKSTFPDVLDQRTIPESERWWRLVGTLTDDRAVNVLRAAFDKDYYSQPAVEQLQQIILQIRRRDPEQWAYYEAREDAADWKLRTKGEERDGGDYKSPAAQAVRNFRKAIYRGDVVNAERFYSRLIELGYTAERLDASIRSQHPLNDLKAEERTEYLKTLTAKQKQELELATKYYQKLKALDGRERQLFPRKGQKASPKPELLKRIVEDQSRNK